MITIKFSKSFERAYKKLIKRNPEKAIVILEKIHLFQSNPQHSSLITHKLTGTLSQLYAFKVEYDLRIIFAWYSSSEVILEDIGTHDEVY
jgi:addiction module RelE/StbE family toxin